MGFMDKMKVKAAEMRARAHSVVNSPGHASDGFRSAETTPVWAPERKSRRGGAVGGPSIGYDSSMEMMPALEATDQDVGVGRETRR